MPKVPYEIGGFESYAEGYERFYCELAFALRPDVEEFVDKWGANEDARDVPECAAEAMVILRDIQETVANYAPLIDKYNLAAFQIFDAYDPPTIGCTVRTCLKAADRFVGAMAQDARIGRRVSSDK